MSSVLDEIKSSFASQPDLVEYEWVCTGQLNGQEIYGDLYAVYGREENEFRASMIFDNNDEIGNTMLVQSSCSNYCISSCCIYSPPLLKARNLLSVFGHSMKATADYHIWSAGGKVLGTATQIAKAEFEFSKDGIRSTGTVEINGQIDNRTDYPFEKIRDYSPGYVVFLRQVGRGRIDGNLSYPYYETTDTGAEASGTVAALRKYYYDTDEMLPFPQIQSYYLRDISVTIEGGKRIVDFTASGYYLPLEPVEDLRSQIQANDAI